ncbi:MAG: biopolymer transporter ExbD [Kofleriaceae bacterium]|nr:biopolymer transporter ExbD [Kofleriaceae bacterium]
MGISAGGSKGGPKSEMNVTPLVDVMLVLLVIFMVTMPVMMRSITIEIPRDLDTTEVSIVKTNIVILGLVDGTLEVSDGLNEPETVQRTQLAKVLRGRLKDVTSEKTVFVDFQDGVPWDQVISVMDTVKGVGKVTSGDSVREVIKVALKKRKDPAELQ